MTPRPITIISRSDFQPIVWAAYPYPRVGHVTARWALPQFFTPPNQAFRSAILARYDHSFGVSKMLVQQRTVLFPLGFFALALLSGLILPLSTISWKALWIALCFFGLYTAHHMGPVQSLGELGLGGDIAQGWLVGLFASLPMFAGLAIASRFVTHTSLNVVLASVLFGPFAEEVLFRGYLFLQLYRRAQWSLRSAITATALVFGLVRLRNMRTERDLWRLLAEVLITGLGGAFFAWLLVRWDNNLWVPIGMHVFMNLWWEIFAVDRTAIGNWIANAARISAVAAAVVITLQKTRRIPISRKAGP